MMLLWFLLLHPCYCNLWVETERISDLQQFRALCGFYQVARAYMEDSLARITVFAPVDDVFTYNPDIRALTQKETLAHFVDTQVVELGWAREWENNTLVRTTINSGYVYITQFEVNPGNFSYFANAGMVCNHATNQWGMITGEQYLYKICTPMGQRPYPGTALSFLRDRRNFIFNELEYTNRNLTNLRNVLDLVPDIALVIYGAAAWNAFHTFFLPNDAAFAKVTDRTRINRDVLLAHVTGVNKVLFTWPWMYDGGLHYYPTVLFSSNVIEDNFMQKLVMKNITDPRTGRYTLYAVSEVYQRYANFRRGAVWAKILVPNIPVMNGVVHIVDTVLGIVTSTIEEMVRANPETETLMRYINNVGENVRGYLAAHGGLVTFFAPWQLAFDRIPEQIERRLLRDKYWLSQILLLHVVPGQELTTDEITNDTIVGTVDNMRYLYFIRGEWPKNNITYYVIGGGTRTAMIQDNVAATNGIIHYTTRVLGVPYDTLWAEVRNDSRLQTSFRLLDNLQLKYTMDPYQVLTPDQNLTVFLPNDAAWAKVSPLLMTRMTNGKHWPALQYVFKRHIIQGQALMYTDLRTRSYVMMNDEKVLIRNRGRYFELFWPKGNRVANIINGGEIAGINGFIHTIDTVLIYDRDLSAPAATVNGSEAIFVLFIVLLMRSR